MSNIYSIGEDVNFASLGWQSDWSSRDIFGEDYHDDFAIGLYCEFYEEGVTETISYYIDLRDGTVMTIFIENEENEDIETIWNEEYFK